MLDNPISEILKFFRKNKKKVKSEDIDKVSNIKSDKKMVGSGSIFSGMRGYFGGDDTTTWDTEQIRDSYLQNSTTYRYVNDLPREALYENWKIVSRDSQSPDNEGLRAVLYWKELFEADEDQVSLGELLIFADSYFREYGEVALELRFARNPFLTFMGFTKGEMLKHIDLISPNLIPQDTGIQYGDDGKINKIEIQDNNEGTTIEITSPDELRRIIYFHNQPPNEHRGVSRLRPLMSLLDGNDDLRELDIIMMEHMALPVEFFTIDEEGLAPQQVTAIRTDLETELDNLIEKRRRCLIVNKRVEFNMIGTEGKNLDIHVLSDRIKGDIYQGLGIPLPYIEAEGSTKSTVEIQHQHYHRSQLMAQDQAFGKKLTEKYIFPIVLREMSVDVRLKPELYFPQPYTAPDALAQSLADRNYIEVIGEPAIQRVMEREGFRGKPTPIVKKEKEKGDDVKKQGYEYINGRGRTHQIVDSVIDEGELIARKN
jgi:hypothetical protein